jgi:hypothetical protein
MNAAMSDNVAVAQKPPFYIASGFWHCGFQIYNPEIDEWHWSNASDGQQGRILFLNNEIFTFNNQWDQVSRIVNFNSLSSSGGVGGVGEITGSENILGRAYRTRYSSGPLGNEFFKLQISNNDGASFSNFQTPNDLTEFKHSFNTINIIPNEPDKVVIREFYSSNNVNHNIIKVYSGFNQPTPSPVLEQTILANDVYDNSLETSGANVRKMIFDTRQNGKFWMILKPDPAWGSSKNRIVEFDPVTNSYIDITFVTDDEQPYGEVSFPKWLYINDIEVDRQTGILYIGTTRGVYYLDRDAQVWRKYSTNVPFFSAKLGIIHCTGEIYASSLNRGIWKAPLIRNENAPTLEWNITTNTTWEDRINLFCTLTVEPGATLTVKSDLVVYGNQKIVVKKGGRLVVDGGTITTECGQLWQGIEVQGDRYIHQNNINQGEVQLINGAVIEYALNGIRTIGTDANGNMDWNKTGGIVRVNGAEFRNCWRGIEFLAYANMPPGSSNEMANVSFVINSTFKTTEALPGNIAPYCGVSLFEIKGIKIRNCDFINDRPDIDVLDYTQRGAGIISMDASYKVSSGYNMLSGAPIANTANTFTNLFHGVYVSGASGLSSVTVNDNNFDNCIFGISLLGSNYVTVGRNDIAIGLREPGYYAMGVYTRGATAFNIEQNQLYGNHNVVNYPNQGVHTSATFGTAMVYRNQMSNTTFGNQTTVANSATKIDCNTYTKGAINTIDFHHASGVLANQGECNQGAPAFNTFNGTCNNTLLSQIYRNSGAQPFQYNYQQTNNTFDVNCSNLWMFAFQCDPLSTNNSCPNNLPSEVITEKPIKLTSLKMELGEVKTQENNAANLLAQGDSHALIDAIHTLPPGQVKDTLLYASPYLSDRVLLAYLQSTPPPGHSKDVVVANAPVSDTVMSVIDLMDLPPGIYDQIVAAQTGSSPRTDIERLREYMHLERLLVTDRIVREYLDTLWIDSAALFLADEATLEARIGLIAITMSYNPAAVPALIESLRAELMALQLADPTNKQVAEYLAYCDFQELMHSIKQQPAGYYAVDEDTRRNLENWLRGGYLFSPYAQSIVMFLNNKLPLFEGEDAFFPKNMTTEEASEFLQQTEYINKKIQVFPNPTKGQVSFLIDENNSENGEIIITDIQGKIIKIISVTSTSIVFDFTHLPSGVYLAHLTQNGKILCTQKVLYEK